MPKHLSSPKSSGLRPLPLTLSLSRPTESLCSYLARLHATHSCEASFRKTSRNIPAASRGKYLNNLQAGNKNRNNEPIKKS